MPGPTPTRVLSICSLVAFAVLSCSGPDTAGQAASAPGKVAVDPRAIVPEVLLSDPNPADRGRDLHGVSGMRFFKGQLWLVLDWPNFRLARVELCTGADKRIEVQRITMQKIIAGPTGELPEQCPQGLLDAEALELGGDGSFVIGSDGGQVGRLVQQGTSDSWYLDSCRRYEPTKDWDNKAFEAVFIRGGTTYAVEERTYATGHNASGKLRVEWTAADCGGKKLRITDAVATQRGAVLLASCRIGGGEFAYFLGALQLGERPKVTATVVIHNPRMRNLEGFDLGPGGRVFLVNDDSDGGNRVRAPTELWSLPLDASERSALGLPSLSESATATAFAPCDKP